MKPIFTFLLISLLICATIITGSAQESDDYTARLDSLLQTNHPRSFNGVILITKNGKIKYRKVAGYSHFESKTLLNLNDNFRIMSNSKQVTAVLLLKEVEKGKIDLQSPIRKYLPNLPRTWADTVTVHQLLNFSAGITDVDKPLQFRPGTDFLYGVTTYTLLSKIIEKVSGKTYVAAAHDLFAELKMNNSFCYEEGENHRKPIAGYINTGGIFKLLPHPIQGNRWTDFIPAGGIVSNAKDLLRWDTQLHQGKILKPETYRLMTTYTITAQHDAFGDERFGYGYGVRIGDKASVAFIGHSGKGLGFTSIKLYFPEKKVDVIVLENQYSEDNITNYYFEIKVREIVMNSILVR